MLRIKSIWSLRSRFITYNLKKKKRKKKKKFQKRVWPKTRFGQSGPNWGGVDPLWEKWSVTITDHLKKKNSKTGLGGGGGDPLWEKWPEMISDVHWPFFSKAGPTPPPRPALHIQTADGRTYIQTDGDYIKRVVHGPPGDHTLKNCNFDWPGVRIWRVGELCSEVHLRDPHFGPRIFCQEVFESSPSFHERWSASVLLRMHAHFCTHTSAPKHGEVPNSKFLKTFQLLFLLPGPSWRISMWSSNRLRFQ